MKIIMYLLSSIIILTFCSSACNACCVGYDPVFESNPSFEYIGSTVIKISWENVQRNLHCADKFQVVYWETDRKESTKLTETLFHYDRSYNIHVKEGVAYSFAVNAIEEAIGQCDFCSWACAIGSSICCVGNGWSGDVSVPATRPECIDDIPYGVGACSRSCSLWSGNNKFGYDCNTEFPSACQLPGKVKDYCHYSCSSNCSKAFRLAHGNMYNWIPETEKVFQFASEIPSNSPDGIGFKTEVRVQAFADHTLRVKFEGSGYLGETVLVQLKRGHVKGFFVGREEPNVVTNIKRSFLSQIALGIAETSHTELKTPYTGMMIELLRIEEIVARLPLPSKTRRETIKPIRHNITSSANEGPVDQIRLCDSDKDCPEGTRCLSHCNRWACVVQCIPLPDNNLTSNRCPGNFCDVTEKWWGQAVDSCKCPDLSGPENPDCQLQFDEVEKTIMCQKNSSHSCRVAIEAWATAYKNAPNANDICCKYGDPNYNGSQTAWNSCSSGITDFNEQLMPTNKTRGRIAKRIGEAATWN